MIVELQIDDQAAEIFHRKENSLIIITEFLYKTYNFSSVLQKY